MVSVCSPTEVSQLGQIIPVGAAPRSPLYLSDPKNQNTPDAVTFLNCGPLDEEGITRKGPWGWTSGSFLPVPGPESQRVVSSKTTQTKI
jgi:hypothetical protein